MAGKNVAIRHPRDPGRPWVIPAERYDSATHELWPELADASAPAPRQQERVEPEPAPLPAPDPAPETPWWETEK